MHLYIFSKTFVYKAIYVKKTILKDKPLYPWTIPIAAKYSIHLSYTHQFYLLDTVNFTKFKTSF